MATLEECELARAAEHRVVASDLRLSKASCGTGGVTERRPAGGSRLPQRKNGSQDPKIRDFTLQKLPYSLVVGDKESETEAVRLRVRSQGDQGGMPLEDFVTRAGGLVESKSTSL